MTESSNSYIALVSAVQKIHYILIFSHFIDKNLSLSNIFPERISTGETKWTDLSLFHCSVSFRRLKRHGFDP